MTAKELLIITKYVFKVKKKSSTIVGYFIHLFLYQIYKINVFYTYKYKRYVNIFNIQPREKNI